MKKLIALFTVLVIGTLGMACGDAGANTYRSEKTYDVTCYSGGQKVQEAFNVKGIEYRNGSTYWQADNKTIGTNAHCVVKEK